MAANTATPNQISVTETSRCGVELTGFRVVGISGEAALLEVLTPCCSAAKTGTSSGVVCKDCFEPVAYGDLALWDELVARTSDAGCPIPEECSEHLLWLVTSGLEQE